jgi:hypothetical protein
MDDLRERSTIRAEREAPFLRRRPVIPARRVRRAFSFLQSDSKTEEVDNVVPVQKNLKLSLFEEDEAPRVMLATAQMVDLASLMEALLRKIAASLANREVSDEQDYD